MNPQLRPEVLLQVQPLARNGVHIDSAKQLEEQEAIHCCNFNKIIE